MKFFSRMLSRAGSKSSPTSSIKRGRPRDKLSSKWFLKYLWFSEVIWDQNITNGSKKRLIVWHKHVMDLAAAGIPCPSTLDILLSFHKNLALNGTNLKSSLRQRKSILILLNYYLTN